MEEKKGNGKTILIATLVIIIIGLIGFVVYDKCFNKEAPPVKPEEQKAVDEQVKVTKQESMRTTANLLIEATKSILESNYELFPGTYAFSTDILETGGIDAPFGGKYVYYEPTDTDKKIGSGVYKVEDKELTEEVCKASTYSYIVLTRDDTGAYKYSICLNTSNSGEDGGYLMGTSEQLNNGTDTTIFYGKAK